MAVPWSDKLFVRLRPLVAQEIFKSLKLSLFKRSLCVIFVVYHILLLLAALTQSILAEKLLHELDIPGCAFHLIICKFPSSDSLFLLLIYDLLLKAYPFIKSFSLRVKVLEGYFFVHQTLLQFLKLILLMFIDLFLLVLQDFHEFVFFKQAVKFIPCVLIEGSTCKQAVAFAFRLIFKLNCALIHF